MSEKLRDDGGPAFPTKRLEVGDVAYPGMSLRDYFAGQALELGGEFFHMIDDHGDPPDEAEHVARIAYAIADKMLAERKK